jgi:hypothetical protein
MDTDTRNLLAMLRDDARITLADAEAALGLPGHLRKLAQQDLARAEALERGEPDPLDAGRT